MPACKPDQYIVTYNRLSIGKGTNLAAKIRLVLVTGRHFVADVPLTYVFDHGQLRYIQVNSICLTTFLHDLAH